MGNMTLQLERAWDNDKVNSIGIQFSATHAIHHRSKFFLLKLRGGNKRKCV